MSGLAGNSGALDALASPSDDVSSASSLPADAEDTLHHAQIQSVAEEEVAHSMPRLSLDEAVSPVQSVTDDEAPIVNDERETPSQPVDVLASNEDIRFISLASSALLVPPESKAVEPVLEEEPVTERVPVLKARPTRTLRKLRIKRSTARSARERVVAVTLLLIFLLALTIPLVLATSYGVSAYNTYVDLRTHASSAMHHLLDVKTLFTDAKAHPATLLDDQNLARAQQDFAAARSDFSTVQNILTHTQIISLVSSYFPAYRPLIVTAQAGSQIGKDASQIGQVLTTTVTALAPNLRSGLLANTKTPLIAPADLSLISSTITTILPLVDDIQAQVPHLSLDAVPTSLLSASEKAQLQQYLPLLSQVHNALVLGQSMVGDFGWLLGVDSPRTFLIQTMDRSELRPTGGFTGQYGTLQISGGRVAPFSLHDIALVEYANNTPVAGQQAPAAYRSWWPFADWGLRDSNLSADFPTSAQLAIQQYQVDMHQQVDGVIVFTPFLIEHILQVTGPLSIPQYNETITAQNLEDRLHYYQLDNAGIRKEEIIENVSDPAAARKLFTSRVEHVLFDQVRSAHPAELLAIGQEVLHNLRTKDLQMYFSNPQLEQVLMQYGDAAQIDTSMAHDGLYVVQANVSASKASQYVRTSIHDNVTLDASGGATHVMQLHLNYTQLGPVYGLDTYRDYVRVYVPPTAKFLWGDGFDTGQPLCDGPYAACPANGVYSQGQLVCPTGQYHAGAAAPMLGDPYTGAWHPLDQIGPPTNMTSDMRGRAMFGGYVVVPKNCSMTVTLSWYVPALSSAPYSLVVQRQAGTFPALDLDVLPTPGDCTSLGVAGLHYDGILTEDATFALKTQQVQQTLVHNLATKNSCYPQSSV